MTHPTRRKLVIGGVKLTVRGSKILTIGSTIQKMVEVLRMLVFILNKLQKFKVNMNMKTKRLHGKEWIVPNIRILKKHGDEANVL